jgi:hypothetical protein
MAMKATRIEDTDETRSPEPVEGRYELPVHKTNIQSLSFIDIISDVIEKLKYSLWIYSVLSEVPFSD